MKILFLNSLFLLFGVGSCLLLQTSFSLPAVISAAGIGLVGSFFPDKYYKEAQSCIYVGAFIGMTSTIFFKNASDLIFLAFISSFIFFFLRNRAIGLGGKLGTIAFLSVGCCLILKRVLWS